MRADKEKKKKIRKSGQSILSSSGESSHYIKRCLQRNGLIIPHCRRRLMELAKNGKIAVRESGKRLELTFENGLTIIVTADFKKSVTIIKNERR